MPYENLTKRQQEIKDMLEQDMSAQEIAADLGITRNAVYQQIAALRRKGSLAANFTPSGAPTRGDVHVPPSIAGWTHQVQDHVTRIEQECAELRSLIGS